MARSPIVSHMMQHPANLARQMSPLPKPNAYPPQQGRLPVPVLIPHYNCLEGAKGAFYLGCFVLILLISKTMLTMALYNCHVASYIIAMWHLNILL